MTLIILWNLIINKQKEKMNIGRFYKVSQRLIIFPDKVTLIQGYDILCMDDYVKIKAKRGVPKTLKIRINLC